VVNPVKSCLPDRLATEDDLFDEKEGSNSISNIKYTRYVFNKLSISASLSTKILFVSHLAVKYACFMHLRCTTAAPNSVTIGIPSEAIIGHTMSSCGYSCGCRLRLMNSCHIPTRCTDVSHINVCVVCIVVTLRHTNMHNIVCRPAYLSLRLHLIND